jgi:hypothetical protein
MSHGYITGNRSGPGRQMPSRIPNDLYPTPAQATEAILREEASLFTTGSRVWEPAAGLGHISEVVKRAMPDVRVSSSDLHDYGYGLAGVDFLADIRAVEADVIITNPPFSYAQQFIERALAVARHGVIILARIELLHGGKRYAFWRDHTPTRIWVHSLGLPYFRDGAWKRGGSFTHAWYVWDQNAPEREGAGLLWLPDRFDLGRCDP